MTDKTGGPAFANQLECNRDGYAVTGGMTMRDYFAAKAMQEWIGVFDPEDGAIRAYKWADAMLEARK